VAAAVISLAGMDPMEFLRGTNMWERTVMQAVAAAASEIEDKRDLARAKMIAHEVGKLFSSRG
jgi:hypothetical protein